MPASRELTITYGGFAISGARQLKDWHVHEEEYDNGFVEFEFVTTAASDSAFATEVIACRDAFRDPRLDLTITQGSETLLSRKHSDNTALDTAPRILKEGSPFDTARSRLFRVRIEYGLPADNVGTDFRRFSDISVHYDASRRRTVTVRGTYTAETGGDETAAFAQYREKISAYLTTVTNGIDSDADWETIEEPDIQRNETDKICNFTITAKEILHNQATGSTNDNDIVDPEMTITTEQVDPGNSLGGGGFSFTGSGTSEQVGAGKGLSRPTVTLRSTGGDPGSTTTFTLPQKIVVVYTCSIDSTRTKDLKAKFKSVIKPFLISQAKACALFGGITLIQQEPGYDFYNNRINARLEFMSYPQGRIKASIRFEDSLKFGKSLVAVWTKDPFDYYEKPGPAVRIATTLMEYEDIVTDSDPNKIVAKLTPHIEATTSGLTPSNKWMPVFSKPAAVVFRRGLTAGGTKKVNIAKVTVERVAQFRNKRIPSTRSAGSVTATAVAT